MNGIVKGATRTINLRRRRFTALTFRDGARRIHVSTLIMQTHFAMVAIVTSHHIPVSITSGRYELNRRHSLIL